MWPASQLSPLTAMHASPSLEDIILSTCTFAQWQQASGNGSAAILTCDRLQLYLLQRRQQEAATSQSKPSASLANQSSVASALQHQPEREEPRAGAKPFLRQLMQQPEPRVERREEVLLSIVQTFADAAEPAAPVDKRSCSKRGVSQTDEEGDQQEDLAPPHITTSPSEARCELSPPPAYEKQSRVTRELLPPEGDERRTEPDTCRQRGESTSEDLRLVVAAGFDRALHDAAAVVDVAATANDNADGSHGLGAHPPVCATPADPQRPDAAASPSVSLCDCSPIEPDEGLVAVTQPFNEAPADDAPPSPQPQPRNKRQRPDDDDLPTPPLVPPPSLPISAPYFQGDVEVEHRRRQDSEEAAFVGPSNDTSMLLNTTSSIFREGSTAHHPLPRRAAAPPPLNTQRRATRSMLGLSGGVNSFPVPQLPSRLQSDTSALDSTELHTTVLSQSAVQRPRGRSGTPPPPQQRVESPKPEPKKAPPQTAARKRYQAPSTGPARR